MSRLYRVAVADRSICAMDHDLAAAGVMHDLASSVHSLTLGVNVGRGATSFGCDDVPAAIGARYDMSFVARHGASFRMCCRV
jgi:hypothetical protein